jgi:hypothetical protein
MKLIVTLVLMAACLPAAAAQINKCVDRTGKVVGYGTECPAGSSAEETAIRNAPPAAGSAAKSLAERDADFRKRQMEKQEAQAKAQKQSAEREQRQSACEQSRAYLKALQGGHRISRTDPKTGERSFLNDSEYPQEIAKAQSAVSANCK